ncbi:hypothetical protein HYDPIDRAFT_42495 [Hydnomerulius pinastri MD-312]|uniref:F-box domain-containing protein n=1 Tax=Hydnomerulius pinastri MD-312 TaxID=994086 RepID=A0A0C9VU23_9AGAM|nr:hypothetical protein HYDPIDRAFT_42495 [Hydnomerulius pinastri MD-312]
MSATVIRVSFDLANSWRSRNYEQLCVLCGVAPTGGPTKFWDDDVFRNRWIAEIAEEIQVHNPTLNERERCNIISEAISEAEDAVNSATIVKFRWPGFIACMAVGYFGSMDGAAPLLLDAKGEKTRFPNGAEVQIRRVCENLNGDFRQMAKDHNTTGQVDCYTVYETTHCSSKEDQNPNFFLSEVCYHYLQAWLKLHALPPQNPDVPHTPNLSFQGELYEIVNSRREMRDGEGLLPCIQYGVLSDSCEPRGIQEVFPPGHRGYDILGRAIARGLRGDDLVPEVFKAFNCYMFVRPDIWPACNDDGKSQADMAPLFKAYELSACSRPCALEKLSIEVLFLVSSQLPISSYLALSATSKFLRKLLTETNFIDRILKDMMLCGSLRWIMPVDAMPGEVEAAVKAAGTWLKSAGKATGSSKDVSVFRRHDFSAVPFIRACFESDSMMNRKRIWGQVGQFARLWRDFRTKGWEINRF